MKKVIASLLVCASMLSLASDAWAGGYTWNVERGPDGTMRVRTSDGTFIVDIEGDNAWVGTEEEYEQRRIAGVLQSQHVHEFHVNGQSANQHQVVSDRKPQIALGATDLADIYTTIYFDAKADKSLHRPAKPANSEYVGAVWVQSDKTDTQVKIVDQENHTAYSAHYCHNIDGNMRTCEFIIPRDSLAHQSALLFAGAHNKPVLIPRASLVIQDEEILLEKYEPSMGSRFGLDEDDAAALKSLHELDNTIATSLPPLPPGVKEMKPYPKSCKQDTPVLTQAQYDAITIGQTIDEVKCKVGPADDGIVSFVEKYEEDIYQMKGKKCAYVRYNKDEPRTITKKYIETSCVIER